MLCYRVTFGYQPALSFRAEGSASIPPRTLRRSIIPLAPFPPSLLRAPSYKLMTSLPTPFLSHISKSPAHNSFPLINLQKAGGIPHAWSDQFSSLLAVGCRLSPFSCPLTPFPTSLSQKQGGTRHWSYQRSSLPTVGCRLLAFPSASPPCSTPRFPLKWELPFPVLTGVKP